MIEPTDSHFDGPLAPLSRVLRLSGPGDLEDLKEIREREGEEEWAVYWGHVEGLIMKHLVDRCGLLDELTIDVQIMEDFHGELYVQCSVQTSYDRTPPLDKPSENKWPLN